MRLIDAKFAVYAAESEFDEEDASKIRWLLSHIPTVDAEPVRQGEWIAREIEKKGHFIMKIFVPVCSVCDAVPPNHIIPKYCPNCGAKMDGGKQDAD